jgi:anti-sigma factor RsiW
MTCREFVEFLGAYLSDELPEDVRDAFDRHLAECADCTAYLRTYEQTVRLAKAVCVEPEGPVPAGVPEDLVQAILSACARN